MTPLYKPLPPQEAIAALRRRGGALAPSFDWREVWQNTHATMFTVAKSTGFEILQDILDGLREGLEEGGAQRDFARRLEPILRAKGWWGKKEVVDPATGETVEAQLGSARRLRTIFEVNLRVSYAQGAWARQQRDKAQRPWLRYVALMDGRARPAHAARHNVCLPVDDRFWDRWYPPCGWGCRCAVQSLSDRDMARLQREGEDLRFEAPADRDAEWVNTRAGEVERVTAGIDPGWDYNPGKAALSAAQAVERTLDAPEGWTTTILEQMPRDAREVAYRRWVSTVLAGGRPSIGHMPLGRMSKAAARGVGAEGDATWLVMPQATLSHALRPPKRDLDRDPDERTLRDAPQLLARPIAVLRERATGVLIYLVGRDAWQWTRMVVNPAYRMPSRGEAYRGRMVRAAVVTVDRVALAAYPQSTLYEMIWGSL